MLCYLSGVYRYIQVLMKPQDRSIRLFNLRTESLNTSDRTRLSEVSSLLSLLPIFVQCRYRDNIKSNDIPINLQEKSRDTLSLC